MKNKKVFLGGTCGSTLWRDELTKQLHTAYFNPIVDDWTEECIAIEDNEKENLCDIHLYVITKEMQGVYSIAEAVDSANRKDICTIFHVESEGFSEHQIRSLDAVSSLIKKRGGYVSSAKNMAQLAAIINNIKPDY